MRLLARALLGCLLLAAAPHARAKDTLTPAQFRDRLAEAVAAITHKPTRIVDERTFKATGTDGTEVTLFIDNSYNLYLASPEDLEPLVERFARVMATPADEAPGVDKLVLIVRPSDYLEGLPVETDAEHAPVPGKPLAGDLSVFLAIDAPETIAIATAGDLARWKIDADTARSLALLNLRRRIGTIQSAELEKDQAEAWTAESGLASGLLADARFCGQTDSRWEGKVAFLAERDVVLVLDGRPGAAPKTRSRIADRISKGATVSRTPIVCRQGSWIAEAPAPR